MRPSRTLRTVAFCAVLSALVACGGGKKPVTPSIVEATTRPGQVKVTATGAQTISFTGTATLQIIVTDQKDLAANLRFTSVTIPQPVKSGSVSFQGGFNLSGQGGEGRFEIGPRPSSPSPGSISSTVFLQITSPRTVRYDNPATPCTVEVFDRAHRGKVTCASLKDSTGQTVAFSMEWGSA